MSSCPLSELAILSAALEKIVLSEYLEYMSSINAMSKYLSISKFNEIEEFIQASDRAKYSFNQHARCRIKSRI